MSRTEIEERYFTEAELAARYGLARKTLRNWRAEGRGPRWVKVGARPLYPASEVAKWEGHRRRHG
jgi:predicted DNA-binding transcriptional regulator AlpA